MLLDVVPVGRPSSYWVSLGKSSGSGWAVCGTATGWECSLISWATCFGSGCRGGCCVALALDEAEGDEGLSMDSGLDWEVRLEMVEPCAWTTEASGEAGRRTCWWWPWMPDTRFLWSFLIARGDSVPLLDEEEVGAGGTGFELEDGAFPIVAMACYGLL